MRRAIEGAKHTIVMCSYIFDYDATGELFVEAHRLLPRMQEENLRDRYLEHIVQLRGATEGSNGFGTAQ